MGREVDMATFATIPLEEARISAMPPRRATQEQYRQYVRQLTSDTAGQLQLSEGDRPITERARLQAAAKAEGITLQIQRKGNTIVFWETQEQPKPRASGRGNGRRRG
jgi:hypothetical protein